MINIIIDIFIKINIFICIHLNMYIQIHNVEIYFIKIKFLYNCCTYYLVL